MATLTFNGSYATLNGTSANENLDLTDMAGINGVATLYVYAKEGDDIIHGSKLFSKNYLNGDTGNDMIYGGTAMELEMNGGEGNDIIYGGTAMVVSGSKQKLRGGSGDDILYLSGGFSDNRAFGDAGNDTIYGSSGDDNIYSDQGIDKLYGGAGNDLLGVGDGFAYLMGGDGIDTISFRSGGGHERGFNLYVNMSIINEYVPVEPTSDGTLLVNKVFFYDYIENLTMNIGDDVIVGNHLDNIIDADWGNDKLYGGDGNDTLIGGRGSDLLQGGLGSDILKGELIADVADYSDSSSRIVMNLSNSGHDVVLTGTDINSTAYGDQLFNISNLIAGGGDDFIYGSSYGNHLQLGNGNDEAYGLAGNDIISGDDGNDTIFGGDGHDNLKGGLGDDRLLGGNGFDSIFFGLGKDNVWGGNGSDTFIIEGSTNSTIASTDIIRDFDSTEDMIDLSSLGIEMSVVQIGFSRTAGIDGFNVLVQGHISIDVMTGNTGDITLNNIII